jgi:Uma2 family endonuclease
MEPDLDTHRHPIKKGEPAWDVALLFPNQGHWTEAEYLALHTNRLIELSDGCLEVLPMATLFHQFIVQFLYELLRTHVQSANVRGYVFIAPLRIRLWPGKIREPDVVFITPRRIHNLHEPPDAADLAMEVVSGGAEDRKRDLETKRTEYAQAGIAEYWIVDPQEHRITVLTLDGAEYRVHGEFAPGVQATSVLLPGFAVDVAAVFTAGEGPVEAN